MANLTRLSVLIGDADVARNRETAQLVRELGVRHVVQVYGLAPLLDALKKHAFDLVMCADQLGDEDGVAVLRAARDLSPASRTLLMRDNEHAGAFVPDDIEAIELPLSRLELQASLQRAAAPSGGLWCEIPELSVSDILQIYHQARRSITVLLSGPIAGRIWLEDGDIVDAEAEGERGLAALSQLLAAESGLVRTEPSKGPVRRSISAPFQSVLLEAARKLDERRRDTLSTGYPAASVPLGAPAPPRGNEPPAQLESSLAPSEPREPDEQSQRERTSMPGALLRPAMTPPVQAPPSRDQATGPEPRGRRRSTYLATIGVLLGLGLAGAAASYLGSRVAISQNRPALDPPAAAPRAGDPRARELDDPAPALREAPAETPGVASREPPAREPASPSAPAPSAPPPARAATPAPAPPASFDLVITSRPPRATVSEGSRVLGKTPLRLTISKSSVADRPREFILRLAGYLPVRISQGASDSSVDAAVILSPRPVVEETPDGGLYEPDLDSAEGGSGNPRARRRDLGIRLRR